jgi:hypothetical protein
MSRGKVAIPASVQFVRVEGDYVLMDLNAGVYFGLDAVASTIWESLAEHGDPALAAEDLCDEFAVEPAQALADVERWVGELAARGLVELVELHGAAADAGDTRPAE